MYEQSTIASPEVFSQPSSQHSSNRTTPASSFSGASGAPTSLGSHYSLSSGASEKCTCKSNTNRIPRPRNAFILFRQKYHQAVLDEDSMVKTNPEVSRELGRRWRNLPPDEKEHWNRLAEEEKANHAKRFPGYRYTPRRNGKKGSCPGCRQKLAKQQQMLQMPSYGSIPEASYGYMMLQQPMQTPQQQMMPSSLQLQQQLLQYPNFMTMPAYASGNVGPAGLAAMPVMAPQFQLFGFNSEVSIPVQHQEKLLPLSSAVNATSQVSPFAHGQDVQAQFHYDNNMPGSAAAPTSTSLLISVPNTGSVNVNLGANPPRFNSLPNNYSNYAFEMMPHQS